MDTNLDPDPMRDREPATTDPGSPDEPPVKTTSKERAALTIVTQMAYRDGVRDAITILSLGIVTGLLAHKLWKIEL